MFKIDSTDLNKLFNNLNIISEKKGRAVQAISLNKSAFDARKAGQDQTRKAFDLKSDWLPKGIRVLKAKSNSSDIKAAVYSKDEYLALQEFGGTKRAPGGGNLSIPLKDGRANKSRTSAGKIRKSLWASNLLQDFTAGTPKESARAAGKQGGRGNKKAGRAKSFIITKGGKKYVVRTARKRAKQKELIGFYHLKKTANIKPKYNFRPAVIAGFEKNFNKHFETYLDKLFLELK